MGIKNASVSLRKTSIIVLQTYALNNVCFIYIFPVYIDTNFLCILYYVLSLTLISHCSTAMSLLFCVNIDIMVLLNILNILTILFLSHLIIVTMHLCYVMHLILFI